MEITDANLPEHFSPPRPRAYYRAKLGFYCSLVRTGYRLPIDSETRERWTELMMLGRAGDRFLDDNVRPDEQDARMETFLDHLANNRFASLYPTLSKEALGTDVFNEMVDTIDQLTHVSIDAKTTPDINKHIKLRVLEGALTADAVTHLATEYTQSADHFSVFARHFRMAGAWACIGNSSLGFRSDTKNNEIAVPYSWENHALLYRQQVAWGIYFARRALSRSIKSRD